MLLTLGLLSIPQASANVNFDLWGYNNQDGIVEFPQPIPPTPDWTKGNIKGWSECNFIPYWFGFQTTEAGQFNIYVLGDYLDTNGNYGTDYFKNFTLTGTGFTGTPRIKDSDGWHNLLDSTSPPYFYSGGVKGEVVDTNWGGQAINYTLQIEFAGAGNIALKFYVHLAKGNTGIVPPDKGASHWSHDNIHVSSQAQGEKGSQDTTIQKPPPSGVEGEILVGKNMEGKSVTGYEWTLEKSASPSGTISLTPGEEIEIKYTIKVTKTQVAGTVYQVRGSITITNTFTKAVVIDLLDQVQDTAPSTVPGTKVDDAQWSKNDLTLPPGTTGIPSTTVLYIPGSFIPGGTADDWFTLTSAPSNPSAKFYNVVWIGYGTGTGTHDPTTASWDPLTKDYETIVSSSWEFTFTEIVGKEAILVVDEEGTAGPISIVQGSIVSDPLFDGKTAEGKDYWIVESTKDLKITKTVRCEESGTAYVIDKAVAAYIEIEDGTFRILDPPGFTLESNTVTLTVEQSTIPPPTRPLLATPRPAFVGGSVTTANKLAILSPYLALIGLTGAIATTYVTRRRRRTE